MAVASLLFAAGPALAVEAERTDTTDTVIVQRVGDRTLVHIDARGLTRARLSEPFRAGDRARLYVTLENAALPRIDAAASDIESAGLLGITASHDASAARVVVDAPSIGDYGLERTADGLVLWLEPRAKAPALVAAAASTAAPRLDERIVARVVAMAARVRAWMRSAERADLIAAWPLAVALLPMLIAVLLHALPHKAGAETERAPARTKEQGDERVPSGAGRPARVWAARTLVAQGLDAAAIAERTGLPRDAAQLLIRTERAAKAAGPGTNFPSGRPRPLAEA